MLQCLLSRCTVPRSLPLSVFAFVLTFFSLSRSRASTSLYLGRKLDC